MAAMSKDVKLARAKARKLATPKANRYEGFPDFCERMGLPEPIRELRFHGERLWRFDFAWPEYRVFLEVQGGLFTNGRHNRGAAMLKEFEKINAATILGWRPLYCQPCDLFKLSTVQTIRAAIAHGAK